MSNPFQGAPTYDAVPSSSSTSTPQSLAQPPVVLPPARYRVILFHVLFKAASLAMYLTSGLFIGSNANVLTFVLVTILSACDFWTVKNVSGRLLVGLRWWTDIDAKGESSWRFESYEDQRFIHPTDSNGFWLPLFVTPVVWVLLAFGSLLVLHFMWLLLCLVALALTCINLWGHAQRGPNLLSPDPARAGC
jgi:hypothetical protein